MIRRRTETIASGLYDAQMDSTTASCLIPQFLSVASIVQIKPSSSVLTFMEFLSGAGENQKVFTFE